MRLVVRRGGTGKTSLQLNAIMFCLLAFLAVKSVSMRGLHAEDWRLAAPFVVLASCGLYSAWRRSIRAVIDEYGVKVIRLFSSDIVMWNDLISFRQTPQNNMFWLRYQTQGSRRTFFLIKAHTEADSYEKIVE
ncbi:MAG: hypothetical protein ABIR04_06420, partial [Cypionkella sp.]